MKEILLVDDSQVDRELLAGILRPWGCNVILAEDGPTGLTLLRAHPELELVLLDWNMPDMSGPEFIAALDTLELPKPPKVVMVTAYVEMSFIEEALALGVSEYIMKPFTVAVIREKLALLDFPNFPPVQLR